MRRVLVFLAVLALTGAARAGGPDLGLLERIEDGDRGSNAPPGPTEAATFSFTLEPGGFYENSSTLGALAPGDFDTYLITVTQTVDLELELEDCCESGDTLCFARINPMSNPVCATSPQILLRSFADVPPGTYRIGVGYTTPHSGVFPSGYTLRARAACLGGVCGTYEAGCGGDPSCYCFSSAEGEEFCATAQECEALTPCSGSTDCADGFRCVPDTCCPAGPVCVAMDCGTESTSGPVRGPTTVLP